MFTKHNNQFKEVSWRGVYRDYRLLVLEGNTLLLEIKRFRDEFMSTANLITSNEYLQFTYELWKANLIPSISKIKYVFVSYNKHLSLSLIVIFQEHRR